MATLVFNPAIARRGGAAAGTPTAGPLGERGDGPRRWSLPAVFAATPAAAAQPTATQSLTPQPTAAAPPTAPTRGPKPAMLQSFSPAPAAPEPANAHAAAAAEAQATAALVARCLQGELGAWEALVRREQRRVYGLCYRFTGSPSTAEDMTQEVFLKLYRSLGSFDPAKASFGVWLTTLTRNLLVDHYRRTRQDRVTDSLDEPFAADGEGLTPAERLPDTRPTQEKHTAGVELRARVQEALSKVSPELREAVILRDLQDMDYGEIATILSIPQGTVKSRISRGRAELARLLKNIEGQVM